MQYNLVSQFLDWQRCFPSGLAWNVCKSCRVPRCGCFSKNRGTKYPKMDGLFIIRKTLLKFGWFGVKTPIFGKHPTETSGDFLFHPTPVHASRRNGRPQPVWASRSNGLQLAWYGPPGIRSREAQRQQTQKPWKWHEPWNPDGLIYIYIYRDPY